MNPSPLGNPERFVRQYLEQLAQVIGRLDCQAIGRAIQWIRECRDAGRCIYACGNGGSALIASQMVVDVIKGASYGRAKRFKMIALTDSPGTIMAYANDVDYEVVFVEQLKNFAQPGDLLIGISGSGNSPNVLRAVEYARSIGCRSIGLTTSQGGRLKDLVDLPILVPTAHMGRLEDCFFAITHVLCYAFIEQEE